MPKSTRITLGIPSVTKHPYANAQPDVAAPEARLILHALLILKVWDSMKSSIKRKF